MPGTARIRIAVVFTCALFLAECGGGDGGGGPSVTATDIAATGGTGQTGTVGQALAIPVSVKVTGAGGAPVGNQTVTFAVTAGGGSLSFTAPKTNAQGIASVIWTLGHTAGVNNNTVTASVTGLNGSPVTITASATPGAVASVNRVSGNTQLGEVGQALAQPIVAKVADQFGNGISSQQVTWSVLAGGGNTSAASSTTDAQGNASINWTLGNVVGNGAHSLRAAVGNLNTGFLASGQLTAGLLSIASGDGQTTAASTAVPNPPTVLVTTPGLAPVQGVLVQWQASGINGNPNPATSNTDAQGHASTTWTLSGSAGTQNLQATVVGLTPQSVSFSATATPGASGFNIDLVFINHGTPTQDAAFTAAVARWQQVVTGDLADVVVSAPANSCGANPAINQNVDDLLIFVDLTNIDGPGNILGQASPCFIRTGSSLPAVGFMQFDTSDLPALETNNTLTDVILHEMGHVLGIGTIWTTLGLLDQITSPGDPFFTGTTAQAQFAALGGAVYLGSPVPVENTGGAGTANSHWREANLHNELMTGFIAGPGNPLSGITIGSLQDEGYAVNIGTADAYSGITALRMPQGPLVELKDDVLRIPFTFIDAQGRVIRVIRR